MIRRKTSFIIVALIVLLGGSAALSYLFISLKPEAPKKPAVDMKRFVKTEIVDYSTIVSPLSAKGRVISSHEVALIAEASGKIEKGNISLKKGTSFKKGELLGVIYKDEVELALKARKSEFLNTIANLLPDIKVDFPQYLNAFVKFFNDIDINNDFPDLPNYNDEKFKVFLASRNLLSDYYGILQDEKKLKRHSLYAPFNGTYTTVSYEIGAYVNAGVQVAKMIRTDQLEIEIPVKNVNSKWIEIGDSIQVYSDNGNSLMIGSVIRKADFIDANTQSRSIFVKVTSFNKNELVVGGYKKVVFPGQEIENSMEIPRNAVFNYNEVFIVKNGMLKKEEIEILKWNENSLIFKGIEEGENVVVEPLINAKENTPVNIIGENELATNPQKNKTSNNHTKIK